MIRQFFKDEEGMGTVELVLIIAALVTIAIIFRDQIIGFVQSNLESIFGDASKKAKVGTDG